MVSTRAKKRTRGELENSSREEALSVREQTLQAREEQLRKDRQALEEEQEQLAKDRQEFENEESHAYGDSKPSDVLHLNVGGVQTTVLRRTLTAIPGSMLACKFSGRWDSSMERNERGHIFIDQEYALFRHILKYLRNRANGHDKYPMDPPCLYDGKGNRFDDVTEKDFYRMVDYYGLTLEMYPVALKSLPEEVTVGIESKKVDVDKWTSFFLDPVGHKRRISAYEVTLGTVQRLQIGWMEKVQKISDSKTSGVLLDVSKQELRLEGQRFDLECEDLPLSKGTVVRLEAGVELFVNGKGFPWPRWNLVSRYTRMTPVIAVEGAVEITSVEYGFVE